MMKELSMATLAVHAGERASVPDYTPITTPIHHAVTYLYEDMHTLDAVFAGQRSGYVYSRFANPTVTALEEAIARLEGTESAVACASGMAAVHLALLASGATAGKTVLMAQDLYGGTHSLLTQIFPAQGVHVHTVDMTDLSAVSKAIAETKPAVLFVETISNPLLRVADIPTLAKLAHEGGARLIVDNTFATPCLYRPALHGADYVVYSATKYLSGHGDAMGGLVAASAEQSRAMREIRKLLGNVLGPNEAWLILRGLKTLVLRMRQHSQNANLVAHFLQSHPRVSQVFYPSLPTHPQFTLSRRLFPCNLFGGMVSFKIKGADQEKVFRFMNALRVIVPATSLGDVYSLILYPAHSSHRWLSDEEKQRQGIAPDLVRLSVGIEEPADIIADLTQALDALGE
nr:PLP-dependent transferase [Chloroflexota bacterium]